MQIRNFVVLAGPLAVLSLASACVLTITDGETASASTTDASTVAATGSSGTGSDGSTGTPTDSGTDATTGSSTDTPTGTVESSTTEEDPTTGGETGLDTGTMAGACGWIEADNIYACGGVGEDPDGIIPIDCPEPPVTDAPCDGGQGPIADPGCCYEGLNAYCYLGKLVVEQCR